MGRLAPNTRDIAAVRRGLIIQRVLVDGWSPAEAAAFLGVGEQQVARWVAAYRRDGMASLRSKAASRQSPRRWVRRLRMIAARVVTGLRGRLADPEPAPCVILRRSGDDAPGRR
jgi:hypothetical protein